MTALTQITVTRERTPSSSTSRSSGHSFPERSPSSPAPRQMSQLSNNLSELDQLLQDLNSAQFMAEVDKRNSGRFISQCPELLDVLELGVLSLVTVICWPS
jgi:hypothetical protein